jgi:hypothetical protein
MSEWWTYTLSDLLPFSPRTYYRMIERHNTALWPAQLVTLGIGLGVVWLLRRRASWQGRLISAIVALLWACVAGAFLWKRYATINWAATYFAWAFAIESVLLLGIGVVGSRMSFRTRRDAAGVIGIGLFVPAVVLYPLLAPLLGRGWGQAEIFGVVPDPTVLGTLGLLLLAEGPSRGWLLAVPLLWCTVSGATLWAMGSAEAWFLAAAAILALVPFQLVRPKGRLETGSV